MFPPFVGNGRFSRSEKPMVALRALQRCSSTKCFGMTNRQRYPVRVAALHSRALATGVAGRGTSALLCSARLLLLVVDRVWKFLLPILSTGSSTSVCKRSFGRWNAGENIGLIRPPLKNMACRSTRDPSFEMFWVMIYLTKRDLLMRTHFASSVHPLP